MGQNPGSPEVNIPIPTKIDQNEWCTYPKMVPLVLTHSHLVPFTEAFWELPCLSEGAYPGKTCTKEDDGSGAPEYPWRLGHIGVV